MKKKIVLLLCLSSLSVFSGWVAILQQCMRHPKVITNEKQLAVYLVLMAKTTLFIVVMVLGSEVVVILMVLHNLKLSKLKDARF